VERNRGPQEQTNPGHIKKRPGGLGWATGPQVT